MWPSKLNKSEDFEGGFLDNSRRGGDDDVKVRRVQTIMPVMIKHLNNASSTDEIKFWDTATRMLTFVGLIRNIEESPTKITYNMEDQTGTIDAIKWLEAKKKTMEPEIDFHMFSINSYVRVIGLLREQNEQRSVLILRMFLLEELNELTSHILEVTYALLKGESMSGKSISVGNMSAKGQASSAASGFYGMSPDQALIYKLIIDHNDSEIGIGRSEIKELVPEKVLPNVDNVLQFLVSEGHVYTTSTDDFFKIT